MGFFSTIATAAKIIAPVAGAFIQSRSNERAAETASAGAERAAQTQLQASREAREAYRQAALRGISAIEEGAGDYERFVRPQLQMRPNVAPPGMLTPGQKLTREDLMRGARRNLAASGLRGAGRSGVATINDLDRRFMADAYDANLARSDAERNRQDRARELLGGIRADTGTNVANIETGVGANASNVISQAGKTAGAFQNIGAQERAGAQAAQGDIVSTTLGKLGAIIADETKQNDRDAYARHKSLRI